MVKMGRNNISARGGSAFGGKIYLIIITAGLLAGGLAFAQDLTPPKIPVLYYGTVKINQEPATAGTVVSIRKKDGNAEIASNTTQTDGRYFLEVPCDYTNSAIIIKVNNLIVKEGECVNAMARPSVKLDLSLDMADVKVDSATDKIDIPAGISDSTEVKITFTATSTTAGGQTIATTSAAELTLTRDSANPNNKFTVTFPANTVITGSSAWNGTLIAPTISSISIILPVEEGKINEMVEVINIGFTGQILTFDKPVSILFPGMAGKLIGYSHTGSDFTEITNICSADNGADLVGNIKECKFSRGADLVVWTKHFTYFAVFSQSLKPAASGGGSIPLWLLQQQQLKPVAPIAPAIEPTVKPQILPQVLGVKYYADGSLIRGKDKKIYLIQNNKLVVIRNLAQLRKYAGQKIYDETDEVIRQYLPFPNGSLIRGSIKKIYVITNGKRQPIFTLAELRKKYRGQKIYDVSDKILGLY